MYTIHPFTVHFPIALLLTSGVFTLLFIRRGDRTFEISAYYCLWGGWVGALLATLSGAVDALRQFVGPAAPRDAALISWVNAHAILGILVVVVYGQALLMRRRNSNIVSDETSRRSYLIRHLLGGILLLIDGWIGGHLVYSLGLGRSL